MASTISSLAPHQPFKTLYIALSLPLFLLLLLPLHLLRFLPRPLRQHPSYTYPQALKIWFYKTAGYHISRLHRHPSWSLLPGYEKARWELLPPSAQNEEIYRRGVVNDAEIRPVEIGGTWYPSVYNPNDERRKKVILHFHGGAFITGDGRTADLGYGAHLLTSHTPAYVLGVQYRIASNPRCRFPAALQDAVTAYQRLLDRGIPSSSVILSGDSAGANLVIALLRHIVENPGVMPKPRAALLWCAWVNPGGSMTPRSCSENPRYGTDVLSDVFAEWGIRAYAPPPAVDPHDRYVSPRDHPFKCEGVSMWVQFGSLEILAGDIVRFAEGMRKIEGNEVELHEDENAPHDIFLMGGRLGFHEKAEKMAAAMGAWLKDKL
ncbi:MAG: hypothetical protein LQ338_000151 [Usnochroma carphineum]|nr:MAG: hypothetical protein LQ338_000151 [Usnochroma carphineum]